MNAAAGAELPRVLRLWRYPVKSMAGESLEALTVNARGVDGDRRYALRDAAGRVGSGKTTRRFFQLDGLLALRAVSAGSVPEILFPDGARLRADAPGVHRALSVALGHEVTLAAADEPHVDAAPVHLLTTASLRWLQAALPDARIDERRFRPNVVIETPGVEPIEQQWIGRTLAIGDAVLRVLEPTERCRMVTLAQDDLPEDLAVLRALARSADALFGVYAEIVVPGVIRRGDPVRVRA